MAGGGALALLLAGFVSATPAFGEIGGGGSGANTGGTGVTRDYQYSFDDPYSATGLYAPPQGVGQDSITAMMAETASFAPGTDALIPGTAWYDDMQVACTDALANADARMLAVNPSYEGGQSRVIWTWWNADDTPDKTPWQDRSMVIPEIQTWFAGGKSGTMITQFDESNTPGSSTSFGQALEAEALAQVDRIDPVGQSGGVAVICVAANPLEPPPPVYDLSVSTQASPQSVTAGTTTSITDTLTASNGGSSIVEDVTATSILHFGDATASKTVTVSNTGSADVSFVPSDFGWDVWPNPPTWWFDVQMAQQGKMSAAFDAEDHQASESGATELPAYNLGVTTEASTSDVTAGTNGPLSDTVHATVTLVPADPDNTYWSDHPETLDAQVVAHYAGFTSNGKTYAPASTKAKSFSMTNTGDTVTPVFHASDFGFQNGWLPGGDQAYFFEIIVNKQGSFMQNSVDVNADGKDAAEAVDSLYVPCASNPDMESPAECSSKTVEPGVSADSMVNTTTITHVVGEGVFELDGRDAFTTHGNAITVGNFHVVDSDTGSDITSWYTLTNPYAAAAGSSTDDTVTWTQNNVSASKLLSAGHTYTVTLGVTVHHPNGQDVQDTSDANENNAGWDESHQGRFPTWTFTPDKVWIVQDEDGQWASAIDPSWSNQVAGDGKTFLNGASVGVVVNGTIPANLIDVPTTLTLVDDYATADYIWTPTTDLSKVKVFEQDVTTADKSSVVNIVATGEDVTSQGTVSADPSTHTVTWTPSADFRKSLQGAKSAVQLTMLVPGHADYANQGIDSSAKIEAGNAQALADFGKKAGDELAFCVNPDDKGGTTGASLTNAGSETVNTDVKKTNEPKICGYIPPVVKDVLSASSQAGDQLSIDGKTVTAGQVVTYKLTTTPKDTDVAGQLGYPITALGLDDVYSQYTDRVDKTSMVIVEKTLGLVPVADYKVTWDDAAHQMHVSFTDKAITQIMAATALPSFTVTFDATVNNDVPAGTSIDNQWVLIVDDSRIDSNVVSNPVPNDTPEKDVTTTTDRTVSVNGKTFLVGESGSYWITLHKDSMSDGKNAYPVQQFGLYDNPDTSVLAITDEDLNLRVLAPDGTDVSDKFSHLWDGKTLWVTAKLEPTMIPALGTTIDPPVAVTTDGTIYDPNGKPADLPSYLKAGTDAFDPLKTADIDSSLTDGSYLVGFDFTVAHQSDKSVVNRATQILNGMESVSNQVANPITEIEPTKDVVVNVGDESADNSTIIKGSNFLYQLNSSILPPNRVYQEKSEWTIADQFDVAHDHYTGQWAVYAARDLYSADGKALLAQKGTRIAGSGYTPDDPALAGLFTLDYTDQGLATVTATPAYLKLVSADTTHEVGWTAFIQMMRIGTGDVTNTFTETIDGVDRPSNVVTTHTPDETPGISIEKYDAKTGVDTSGAEGLGNRDTMDNALTVLPGDEVQIGYLITNKGTTALTGLTLTDQTTMGDGTVGALTWPDGWTVTSILAPGESITVYGTLTGVTQPHTNVGTVTAVPDLPCPPTDTDPWDDTPAAPGCCVDHDSDGIPDTGTDTDGDGVFDPMPGCSPTPCVDHDGDGIPDTGTDTDGDGALDPMPGCAPNPTTLTASDPWNATPLQVSTGGAVSGGVSPWILVAIVVLILGGSTAGVFAWQRHRHMVK